MEQTTIKTQHGEVTIKGTKTAQLMLNPQALEDAANGLDAMGWETHSGQTSLTLDEETHITWKCKVSPWFEWQGVKLYLSDVEEAVNNVCADCDLGRAGRCISDRYPLHENCSTVRGALNRMAKEKDLDTYSENFGK